MMKMIIILCIIIVLVPPAVAAGKDLTAVPALKPGYGITPLVFIPNHGQVDRQVRFHGATQGFSFWLTDRGMTFDSGGDVSQLVFVGALASPNVEAVDLTSHRVNFLRGGDKSKWRTNIPSSKGVLYKKLYPGIRLKVYGKERQLEYDWIVEPGADPSVIKWRYSNVNGTGIDAGGDLRIKTANGELVHKAPVSFQVIDGRRVPVRVMFKKIAPATYGFTVGRYDKRHRLIIDPVVLSYSTYLGGSDYSTGTDIAVDGSGCAYVTGYTRNPDFPLVNPIPGTEGGGWLDGFITKFSADGSELVYSTFLGGGDSDLCKAIAVDASGCAYVTGSTTSQDFPLLNAFQETSGDQYGGDVFLTKLSSDGSQLVYSTYLGGEAWDDSFGIAVDANGSACVAGYTYSSGFPLKNSLKEFDNENYYNDGFVTKFSPEGDQLVFSTLLGGDYSDHINDIAVDGSGSMYVTGYTDSHNFPTVNPLQELTGYSDSFVSKIAADGSQLVFSTFLGGTAYESGNGIAVDSDGSVYVTGNTDSHDFPMVNAFDDQYVYSYNGKGFVTKIAPDGSQLVFSTYLGGVGWEIPQGIAVDADGSAIVVGDTSSPDFPVLNAIKDTLVYYDDDAFITKFSPQGNTLVYSTLIGGSNYDKGMGVALDSFGNAYMTGYTSSNDFPVHNAFQEEKRSGYAESAFVTKILNLLISIEAERREERGWLIRKAFGQITLNIENPSGIPIDRFILYRMGSDGTFRSNQEVSADQVQGSYVFIDWQIDKNQSYTYKVEALDVDGNVIAATGEHTIEKEST